VVSAALVPGCHEAGEVEKAAPLMATAAPRSRFVEPQLATLVDDVPAGPGWVYEIKYDGYRTQVTADGATVHCYSRRGLDWTARFGGVPKAIAALKLRGAVLDGEMVIMDDERRTSFGGLQDALKGSGAAIRYVAFDLLAHDGQDLRRLPLLERKERLAKLLPKASPYLMYSAHVEDEGAKLLRSLCSRKFEGIIAKRGDKPYRSGRGTDWVKVKCSNEQEFVVAGYVRSEVAGRPFSSLILALNEAGALRYSGHVGTGFTLAELRRLRAIMEPINGSPLAKSVPSDVRRRAVWIEPRLVVQGAFTEMTSDGPVRHPSYRGIREDKPPESVHRERPASISSPTSKPRRPRRS
jgi:bifunctional non-homologous end joining protein LigD